MAGREEGGSWALVLLLPLSVLGPLMAGEGGAVHPKNGSESIHQPFSFSFFFFLPLFETLSPFVAGLLLANLSQSPRYWHDRRVLPCPSVVML